jgi:hypothetical protein
MHNKIEEFIKEKRIGGLFFANSSKTKADAPTPWAHHWGGHNPATPMAEMQYNYYWTVWPVVAAVAVQTFTMFAK